MYEGVRKFLLLLTVAVYISSARPLKTARIAAPLHRSCFEGGSSRCLASCGWFLSGTGILCIRLLSVGGSSRGLPFWGVPAVAVVATFCGWFLSGFGHPDLQEFLLSPLENH